jgi:hypothetical protein
MTSKEREKEELAKGRRYYDRGYSITEAEASCTQREVINVLLGYVAAQVNDLMG